MLRVAEDRGISHLADRLLREINEQRGALLRPVEESEQRVEALRACVAEADRTLSDLDHLFAAEQDRLARVFSDDKQRFLERAIPAAKRELMEACLTHISKRGPALRHGSVKLAQEMAMRYLDDWLTDAEPVAEQIYARAMDRFVDLSNDFLAQVKASGDSAMANLPSSLNAEVGFRWDSRLFYKDLFLSTGEGPLTWIVDSFRTRESTLRAVERDVGDYLVRLLETNATRIQNDLNERVLESRRRFAFELRSLLGELVDSAANSLARAKDVRANGSQAVEQEIARLNTLRDRLAVLVMPGE